MAFFFDKHRHMNGSRLRGYLAGLAVVVLGTTLSITRLPVLNTAAFTAAFPLGVLTVACRFGIGPALMTTLGGVLAFDFVFVPPALAFALPGPVDGMKIALVVMTAAVATAVIERLRRQVLGARRRAEIEGVRNALLSGLSHDLRTPLHTLVGAGNALCTGRLEPGEHQAFSHLVADEAGRLQRLVTRLLELTRLGSDGVVHHASACSLEDVIGAAICRMEGQLVGFEVVTDVPSNLPAARFDPVLVEQVLVNLVENAIRYAASGRRIEIAVRQERLQLVVEVADHGPGVSAEEQDSVFQKLRRGRAARAEDGGMGLGLAFCHAVVTAHLGRIWLENRPGGGAVVRFTLPDPSASRAWQGGIAGSLS
jgi:K+-sensing histidine kinase KdpD